MNKYIYFLTEFTGIEKKKKRKKWQRAYTSFFQKHNQRSPDFIITRSLVSFLFINKVFLSQTNYFPTPNVSQLQQRNFHPLNFSELQRYVLFFANSSFGVFVFQRLKLAVATKHSKKQNKNNTTPMYYMSNKKHRKKSERI